MQNQGQMGTSAPGGSDQEFSINDLAAVIKS
jgi:hypothetical protein